MNPFRSLFISLSRIPPVLMLFVILGLAVVVTMYVMDVIGHKQAEIDRIDQIARMHDNEKAKVVYTTKNIDQGEIISAEAIEEKDVPAARAPQDAFNTTNAVVGQQAAYPIPAGTIVGMHAIRPMQISSNFEGRIHEGLRALTFGVDTNSGVAGFIAPGSHVDILGITGSAETTKAAPVMSDVEVIAVGTTYQRSPGSTSANPAGSVTVAITPEDSVKLVKAISATKLYLTLRSDKDHTPIAVVDVRDLFPKHAQATEIASLPQQLLPPPEMPRALDVNSTDTKQGSVAPLPPPQHEIEMWSGSKKDVLSVPQG
jgi:pilus assembly protein CpaB